MVYDVRPLVCRPTSAMALYAITAALYFLAKFWALVRYSALSFAIASTVVIIAVCMFSAAPHCHENPVDRYYGPTAANYIVWWDEAFDDYYGY